MKYYLEKVIEKQNLTFKEAYDAMNGIIEKKFDDVSIGAFLAALKTKGETPEEIAGFACSLNENCINIEGDNAIDVCGTGGDNSNTFNISTTAAFVVAGVGIKVAKHGNRAVSSLSGSADVLCELGVNTNMIADLASKALNEIGIVFLFAPNYHPAMKIVAPIRKSLGVKTVFNILGPLLNPAKVKRQLIGVFKYDYAKKMSEAVKYLNKEKAVFVCEENKYDEILLSGNSKAFVYEKNNSFEELDLNFETFGFAKADVENLKCSNVSESAKMFISILRDKEKNDAYKAVVANAAMGLFAAGYSMSIEECKIAAEESILSGKAFEKFKRLKEFGEKAL